MNEYAIKTDIEKDKSRDLYFKLEALFKRGYTDNFFGDVERITREH